MRMSLGIARIKSVPCNLNRYTFVSVLRIGGVQVFRVHIQYRVKVLLRC